MANQIKYQVGFDIQQGSLNQLKTSLQELQKMKISEIMRINDSDAASATSALIKIKQQAGRVEDALRQAFNPKLNTVNIETFNKSLKQSGTSIEQVYTAFKSAGTTGEVAFRNLSSQVLSTNIQLKETHGLLDKMATTLSNTIKWNAASAAVNGMTRSIEQAWGYVKSLDTSLNDIRIVTGKSAEEMGRFAVQANNAAKELGKTTTDYTNAALIYAQQGLSDKEIEERARITLKAANVTGQSTDEVSEQLTAVWNGYKVTAEQAELYVDRLAAVAAKSASDLEELSVGMSKVASAASAMGVGEDQLAAQLSTIISVTRQAPESVGAALRTIYARISDIKAGISEDGVTLGRYSGKMAELGINVLDMNGNLRDMGEVMEEIGGKWGTMSREQQVYLAQTMAGQRQYNNLLALFDNFEQYNEMLGVAQNAAGTLQEQQDIYMQSTAAHLKILKASVEDVYDSLIDTDSINSLIDVLSSAASLVANFVDSIGGGGAVLKALGSIGMSVFSEQIAKGINTVITNLEIGKENARQFDQALQATRNWQGIPGLEDIDKKLLKDRQQLLELSRLMTPEQFSGMQSLLKDITDVGNELARLNDQKNILSGMINGVSQAEEAWHSLDDVMKDPAAQTAILERLSTQQKKLKEVAIALQSYGNNLKELGTRSLNSNISTQLTKMKSHLVDYADKLHDLVESGYLERHASSVERLRNELSTIDDSVPADQARAKLQLIASELEAISKKAAQSASESGQALEREFEQAADSITQKSEAVQQQLDVLSGKLDDTKNRTARAVTIENITKMTSGIAQLGSAIQQIQNIGSIWKNQDLSKGQQVLQTVTNLAISLPMLASGATKVATALGWLNVTIGEQAAAEGFAAAAVDGHVISLGKLQIAISKSNTAIKIFNMTLKMSTLVGFIGILAAATARWLAYRKAQEQAAKAQQQEYKESVNRERQIQAQVAARVSLYNSLDQLNRKYEEGEISRAELKTAVNELIEQYGLEGEAAQGLANSYDNLTTYIRQARLQQAALARDSAKREYEAAEKVITGTASGNGTGFKGNQVVGQKTTNESGENKYQIELSPFDHSVGEWLGSQMTDESQVLIEALQNAGFKYSDQGSLTNLLIQTDFSAESLIALYDTIDTILKELPDEAKVGEFHTGLQSWLDQMKPIVDEYRGSIDGYEAVEKEYEVLLAEQRENIDFMKANSLYDYVQQRKQIIEQYEGDIKAADDYIAKYHGFLFSKYNDEAQFVSKLQKKFGSIDQDIVNSLMQLTPTQLLKINPDDLSSWQDLRNIIAEIVGLQDEATGGSSSGGSVGGASSSQTTVTSGSVAAASTYNAYASARSKVAGGTGLTVAEYDALDKEAQKYFRRMSDGTFKLVGDAEDFYEVTKELSIQGFSKNNTALSDSSNRIRELQGISYSELTKSIPYQPVLNNQYEQHTPVGVPSSDFVNKQLDYLTEFGYDLEQIKIWRSLLGGGGEGLQASTYQDIVDAVISVEDHTKEYTDILQANSNAIYQNYLAIARSAESMKDLHKLLDEGKINYEAFTQAAIELDAALDIQNLDSKELEKYSDYLQQIADKSEELSDELKDNEDAAEIVAKGIMKMNDATEKLSKNWEEWKDVLENSSEMSEEYSIAMGQARGAVADLLDISKDFVSEDFVTQHLDEITKAANGDSQAIDNLRASLARDIVLNIVVQNGIDDAVQQEILTQFGFLQNSIPDLQIGATLDDGEFLNKANAFIKSCEMTADQANAFFDAIGFEATFATEPQLVEQRSPKTVTETKVVGYTSGKAIGPDLQPRDWQYPILSQTTHIDGYTTESGYIDVPAMASNGKTPVIQTLTKKAGGSFNNSSSINKGTLPSTGNKKNNTKKSGTGNKGTGSKGGSGGKSGSGGSAAEPDTSKKDRKQPLEDERDIYHDINIEIAQINRNLDRTQKKQDRLYGKDLLDNLNKQSRILDQHKQKLEEKHDLQEQDLKDQRQTLKNLGVTFDKYGNISNYMSILGDKQAQINNKTKEYNALIDAYNSSTDKDVKKSISDKADQLNKKIQEYEKDYQKLEEKIKNYDGLREEMEDVVDQIDEETQKQIEINIQKFRMNLEIRLQLGEAERDWNEFRREVLEHTDIIKDTDFQKIFSDALQNLRDATSYFSLGGSKGSLQALTNQLMDTRAQIQSINKTGSSAIYGDNKAQAMEDLQDDLDELMDQMQDIQGLIDDIDQAYLDTIDDISDQFDKQIEDYEYIGDLIEHDIDLLQLLYGDRNYNAMDKYYATLEKQNLKQLDMLKQQRDFWKQQWDAAVARGDTQAAKQFEENYKSTIQNLNQAIEDAASTIQNKYINAIENIFNELDKKISNGHGTDYLSTQWELMNKNADEYLDTINTAFAIQETERKYQDAVDEAKSIKNQQVLRDLMNEQLAILRNKEKVTQYDVDRAEKLLQVEQARMALQEAQSAKTSMRLKRDSQGNYSYEYVADGNAVDDAQGDLAQAQNDLYNFDKDRYQSNLDDMLSAWKDFQSEYKDILEDVSLTEQERIEKLALLREQYGEYINDKTTENLVVRNNLMESAFADLATLYNTDVENYNQMSIDQQNILMGDLVPAWESGIQQMANKVAGEGGFIPTCEDAFSDLTDATKKYKNELDDMAQTAGADLRDVTGGVDELAYSFENLIEDNGELTSRMYDEIDAITSLRAEAHSLVEEYKAVYNAAKLAVSGIHSFIQAQQAQTAAQTAAANGNGTAGSSGSGTGSGSGSGSGKNGSGSGTGSGSGKAGSPKGGNGSDPSAQTIEGIAGNIWVYGTWGNDPDRHNNMIAKFGKEQGDKIYNAVQAKFNSGYGYNGGLEHDWEYYKKYSLSSFRSGGYTGTWIGDAGRLAVLHQKEMVLNQEDTKNLLNSVYIMRSVMSTLNGNMNARLEDIKAGYSRAMSGGGDGVEQNVHIEASFPNVDSKREIEQAFNDLVSLAAQRAMRR